MIHIFAGHHANDPGAIAYDGTTEAQLTRELRADLSRAVRDKGIQVREDDDRWTLPQAIQWLATNTSSKDVLVELHFNSNHPTASGVEAFVHDGTSPYNHNRARQLCSAVSRALTIKNRGVKSEAESARGRIGILHTPPRVVLLEVCFLNQADLTLYRQRRGRLVEMLAETLSLSV